MKTGLFFGSFNPIHLGHTTIARFFQENTPVDEVWLIPSPHNPLKKKEDLLPYQDRLQMCLIACNSLPGIRVCDIESRMSIPSFTIRTLRTLGSQFPEREFILLLGSDSLDSFDQWKDYREILDNWEIYIYPRVKDYSIDFRFRKYRITLFHPPLVNISSSQIRQLMKENKDFSHLVHPEVYTFLTTPK